MSEELNRVYDKIDSMGTTLGDKIDASTKETRLILTDHGERLKGLETIQEQCKEDRKIERAAIINFKWGIIYKVAAIILGLALVGLLVL